MKLIKKGRPQRGWAKQITCTGKGHGRGGCCAALLVEESDLFRIETPIWDDNAKCEDLNVQVAFQCSECGVISNVNSYPGDPDKLRLVSIIR